MVSAGQVDELTSWAWANSLPYFALQARGHWFEPSCAHQVSVHVDLDGRLPGNHSGNHPCTLWAWERVPRAGAASSSITRVRPAPTAGTTGIAGAAGVACSARASALTAGAGGTRSVAGPSRTSSRR